MTEVKIDYLSQIFCQNIEPFSLKFIYQNDIFWFFPRYIRHFHFSLRTLFSLKSQKL